METTVIPLDLGIAKAFLLRGEKTVLMDTGVQITHPFKTYSRLFSGHQVKPEDIALIVITHGHTDHFAHLAELKTMTEAPVLCHPQAVPALRTGKNSPIKPRNALAWVAKKIVDGTLKDYTPVKPDILVEEEYDLSSLETLYAAGSGLYHASHGGPFRRDRVGRILGKKET